MFFDRDFSIYLRCHVARLAVCRLIAAASIIVIVSMPCFAAEGTSVNDPHDPSKAVAQLDVIDGLEVALFASEPMLVNPSAIDIDHRGRIWVCELVNYRRYKDNRPEGDRILILEDSDGDGRADSRKVFYQGVDINSPHGVCVIASPDGRGTRVIVSAGSRIVTLIDDDGDDRADRQEPLFTGIEGVQHDHGVHAVTFGPDGRLYFNLGNAGMKLCDREGNPIRDRMGNLIVDERKPYQEGMVFRSKFDGTDVETLAWNFRNPWMVTVDSFGTLWQSDNDDDGNRGTRINFVMEYGNYGYRNELDGGNWREYRTGWQEEIPLRHWHLNDPGVMPNLLQTGGGSPTGITVYEGDLLPEEYRGQLLHTDPGPNVVRCYRVTPSGAGYEAEAIDLVSSERDPWFRPVDVKVAPDGSLIVADWYDPGVGGHGMGDSKHGRLFRIAPNGANKGYQVPTFDFSTPEGAIAALANPNFAVRAMAWRQLAELGPQAEPMLREVWHSDKQIMRARALWILGMNSDSAQEYIDQALIDVDSQIRMVGIRLARHRQDDLAPMIEQLKHDPSPAVRRELAIALDEVKSPQAASLWAVLALQYNGGDRWYLEALGIAARNRWDACLAAWRAQVGEDWNSDAGSDIVWRSRAKATPELLAELIVRASNQPDAALRYFRAFDFQSGPEKSAALTALLHHKPTLPAALVVEAVERMPEFDITTAPEVERAIHSYLAENQGGRQYFWLISHYKLQDYIDELLQLAIEQHGTETSQAAVLAVAQIGAVERLLPVVVEARQQSATDVLVALGQLATKQGNNFLHALMVDDKQNLPLRIAAALGLSKTGKGQQLLFQDAQEGRVTDELRFAISNALHAANDPKIRQRAAELLPLPAVSGQQSLPPIAELLELAGDVAVGGQVFATAGTCGKCHRINGVGRLEVGPDLGEIGSKLSREAMYQSILDPNASISHNYEQYVAQLDGGTVELGLLVNETDDAITLRNAEGVDKVLSRAEIEELDKSPQSLMPAGLQQQLTQQQLVDLVEFLLTLKKKS